MSVKFGQLILTITTSISALTTQLFCHDEETKTVVVPAKVGYIKADSVIKQLKYNHKPLDDEISASAIIVVGRCRYHRQQVDINIVCDRYRMIMTHTIVWARHFPNDAAVWSCRTRSTSQPYHRRWRTRSGRVFDVQSGLWSISTFHSRRPFVLYHDR